MDIKALINPTPSVKPKIQKSSPTVPTPSPTTQKINVRKRKRHDPIPIWAVREKDQVHDKQQRPSPSPNPPPKPHLTPQMQAQPLNHNHNHNHVQNNHAQHAPRQNGHSEPPPWEPSITGEKPYDEMARNVCNFIWGNVVDNGPLREAVAKAEGTHVEIEAKWGQIQERDTGKRLTGPWETECVISHELHEQTKFASTMSLEQHKKMNEFLNQTVRNSKQQGPKARAPMEYKHTRETDMFYDLSQDNFNLFDPLTKQLLLYRKTGRHRVRVTRDSKTNQVLRKIVKHKIENLEISSPQTEWDYRISVNIEVDYPGPIDDLSPVGEPERRKDRMSYTHQSAYQIDLTQVTMGPGKNHELELEVDADRLLVEAERVNKQEFNLYEDIVSGMMNNLRVLSREISWKPS